MRTLIVERLKELSELNNGFSKSTQRWSAFRVNDTHISDISLNNNEYLEKELNDEALLVLFERVIKRANLQM